MTELSDIPVHSSLDVLDEETIYRTEEWWKAVVRYGYDSGAEYDETAIYLWHRDGDWTRKHKYTIKTVEAWKADRVLVDSLFSGELSSTPEQEIPVSDYYKTGAGETVFCSSDWWKAILKVVQKGSYETEEVMIYLWQQSDGEWRRRQKYAIGDEESWQEEQTSVESVLKMTPESDGQEQSGQRESTETSVPEFDQLEQEIEMHLGKSMTD